MNLTDRQKKIISTLRVKDGGANASAFESMEKGEMNFSQIETMCGLINAEFMMEGILSSFEPNEYGLELEELLDVVNRARVHPSI